MLPILELNQTDIGRSIPLISGINSRLGSGELLILTGRNGSGKSTLLKTIAGLIPPLKGEVSVLNTPISRLSRKEMAVKVAFAGTERIREDYITVADMVQYGRYPYAAGSQNEADEHAVQQAISQMGIEELLPKALSHISDGEWQKANLARVLAQQTPIIVLDEPSAFLDYPSRIQLFRDLQAICRNAQKTIIMSTHDVETAGQFGTLFWHISDGNLTESSVLAPWKA